MAFKKATLLKVEFVLEVARKDPQFLEDLSSDPYRTLQESGIDLSTSETLAILDIVNDTSISPLAPFLANMRRLWEDIREDAALRSMFEQPLAVMAN